MDILAESAIRATMLALGVWVVLRTLLIRSPRLVHRAWTIVVVVMLLLPALVAWGPQIAVPLLPAQTIDGITPLISGVRAGGDADEDPIASTFRTNAAQRSITWAAVAIAVYLAVAGLLLARLIVGLHRARAMRRGAVRVHGRLTHPACVVPITVGIVSPAVILPPDWASWDHAELSAVLAHEDEHVHRHDPLVAAAALLNRAIFWFHPLAWWLAAEIARLSEQACDAAVISRGHDSDVYSACLLRFARRVSAAGCRIAPVATAMPGSGLQDRLKMITGPQAVQPSSSRLACAACAGAVLVVVCAAAVPSATAAQDVPFQARGQATWSLQASEHFEVFHDGLPASRVSGAIRDAEAAYVQLSAAFKHDLPRPVPIILLQRDRDLTAAAASAGDVVRQTGDGARQRLVISLESLDRRTNILVHELTHQFAFDIVPDISRLAPVLIEGLAEHQRGRWTADDLRMARAAIATGAIPSVAILATTDRHWAHAAFDFVAAEHGAEGIRQLLLALRTNQSLAQAVPAAFGLTLDQFDQEFIGYVRARFVQP
jgi:beta-lactamase regulating signal transducer with metallopeptidase domain